MFTDGVSTRKKVDAVSGRGVGLAALRQTVRALGGAIDVDSAEGRGTVLRFTFDEQLAISPGRRGETKVSGAIQT
jgi:two-component system chemotaxis sensor kinase CheA